MEMAAEAPEEEEQENLRGGRKQAPQNLDNYGINLTTNYQLGDIDMNGLLNAGQFDDVQIDNLDDILDCSGDDIMDIEQTAFVGSSKVMLKMINNML